MNLEKFNIDGNKRKTYLYDKDGNFLKEFKSISDCARFLNKTPSRIDKSAKLENCIDKKWRISFEKHNKLEINNSNINIDNIYQYNLNGDFVAEYDGKTYKRYKIVNAIKLNHAYMGFQWSFIKTNNIGVLESKSGRVRKVGRYSLDGQLLEVFDKVNDAKRKWGSSAVGCLRGIQNTSKGYVFKYL